MAELVDATDLKSVGTCSRAGSIPAFRTIKKACPRGRFFLCPGIVGSEPEVRRTNPQQWVSERRRKHEAVPNEMRDKSSDSRFTFEAFRTIKKPAPTAGFFLCPGIVGSEPEVRRKPFPTKIIHPRPRGAICRTNKPDKTRKFCLATRKPPCLPPFETKNGRVDSSDRTKKLNHACARKQFPLHR